MSEHSPVDRLPLFARMTPPDPPTGPKAEEYRKEDGTRERYRQWRETDEGIAFMDAILAFAREELEAGAKRMSVRGFMYAWRITKRIRVNNSFSPFIADELVVRDPRLLDMIERRRRS